MQIASSAFRNNTPLPSAYSCDGAGVNPPLLFSDVPQTVKSLALIVDDPDAPIGTFVHWVIYNIPANTKGIAENSIPEQSVQGPTGVGNPGFVAACPPSGEHRYFFKLYALDIIFPPQPVLDKAGLEKAMQGHILEEAQLVGLYQRQ